MNYYLRVLQNYANFSGRARRTEFWYFVLFNGIILLVLGLIGVLIKTPVFGNIYFLTMLIPGIAVGVRRMHDVGKSGWCLLIPFYNFVLASIEGDDLTNQYGLDPRDIIA